MSKKETLEKFFKFMEKWRYEDFNAFENHFNKLMSMKSKEQLTNENEALKDSIAVILAQKKNVHKHCDEKDQQIEKLKQQLAEKDGEIKKLNWQLKDKDFIIKNLNHSLSVAPNANAGQRARIDELTKIVKEKDKEIAELEQELAELKSKYEDCENERLQNRMDYLTMKNKWLNSEKKFAELKEKYNKTNEKLKNITEEIDNNFVDGQDYEKLKQELLELKEKAIIPKFKIGQKLFRINYDYESDEYDVREFNISNYVIFYNDKLWGYPKGYLLDDEDLFATKEEAEKKLQELRGGNEKFKKNKR